MKKSILILLARFGSRAAERKLKFLSREKKSPLDWLGSLISNEYLEDARLIINLFGKSYGIDPGYFIATDTVKSIHLTDWFGDRDLEIGLLMRSRGISAVRGDITLIDFIKKLIPLDPTTKSKLQRMLGSQHGMEKRR